MNQKYCFCLGLLCCLLLVACTNEPATTDTNEEAQDTMMINTSPVPDGAQARVSPDQISFKIDSLRRSEGNCESPEEPCANVYLRYPVAQGGNEQIRIIINDSITHFLIATVLMEPENSTGLDVSKAADKFLSEYKLAQAEMGEDVMGWSMEVEGSVSHQNKKIVNISLENYTFTGGAHPNHYMALMVFDLKSGKKLGYEDLFTNLAQVKKLVEQHFMEAVAEIMGDEEGEMNADDFFWGLGFQLPENFEALPAGIHFYYNPYEAAAYAFGPIDFTIPYSDMRHLVKMDRIQ